MIAEEEYDLIFLVMALSERTELTSLYGSDAYLSFIRESQLVSGKVAHIEVVTGPMFSGKTEEIQRRYRISRHWAKSLINNGTVPSDTPIEEMVMLISPKIDDRDGIGVVGSHSGRKEKATATVNEIDEVDNLITENTKAIVVDEGQFFNSELLVYYALKWRSEGIRVVVGGLTLGFNGRKWGGISDLADHAEFIDKYKGICFVCQEENAIYTQRIVIENGVRRPAYDDEPLILIGGKESYECRCPSCFELPRR